MLPTLNGKRIFLRNLRLDDAQDLLEIYGCKETMQFASDPPFSTLNTVFEMLASVEQLEDEKVSFEWGIVYSRSGKLIGTCGIHSFSQSRKNCEVGCLLNRDFWGQGIMFEALNLLFSHVAKRGVSEVFADIDAPNERSIALFSRLGFTKTSTGQYGLLLEETKSKHLADWFA